MAPQDDEKKIQLCLGSARADFSQDGFLVANAIDSNAESGWAVLPQAGREHWALFDAASPLGGKGGTILTFTLDHQSPRKTRI
jgi:hypothetical protein